MNKTEHIVSNTGLALTVLPVIEIKDINPVLGGIGAVLFIIGSFAPDYDIKLGIRHRGFTHAIYFPLILLIFSMTNRNLFPITMFAIAWFGHLFMDSFSKAGICWLYPFLSVPYKNTVYKKGHKFGYKSGTKLSEFISYAVFAFGAGMYLFLLQNEDALYNAKTLRDLIAMWHPWFL